MAFKAYLEPRNDGAERRRSKRRALRFETTGELPNGDEANVIVHNLSAVGLLIETDLTLSTGESLAVDLPHVGPVGAEIVWRSDRLHGCAFQQSLGEAALAAATLRGEVPERQLTPDLPAGRSSLGERISRIRRERGMTLAQVADALDVSKPTVWAWEKGKARPLPERMEAIAQTLDVPTSSLLESADEAAANSVIEQCRLRIATSFGIDPESIKIMIEV